MKLRIKKVNIEKLMKKAITEHLKNPIGKYKRLKIVKVFVPEKNIFEYIGMSKGGGYKLGKLPKLSKKLKIKGFKI